MKPSGPAKSEYVIGSELKVHECQRTRAAIEHHLSNGLVESTNTIIRLITRRAYGFASPEPQIALAMLSLGGQAGPSWPDIAHGSDGRAGLAHSHPYPPLKAGHSRTPGEGPLTDVSAGQGPF